MKKKSLVTVGLLFLLLVTIAGCNKAAKTETNTIIEEFNVKAFRFGYEPNVINLDKGDKIRINIDNTDVMHGIRIPDFGLRGNKTIEFTAGKTGEFVWYCANMCGEGHMAMQGKIIVK